MKPSLLVACIYSNVWLVGAAVIPSSVTAVLTNEKKPVAAQLFREHVKNTNNYGGSNSKGNMANGNFGFPQYQVDANVFSWFEGRYSYDYVPGETTGLLLSQKALRNDTIELLSVETSNVSLPLGKLALPSRTELIWKYRNGQTNNVSKMYALYLPLNHLQQLGVSPVKLGEFVAACGDDLAYALDTPQVPGLGDNDRPLLLQWANPDDIIVGRITNKNTEGKLKVKRNYPLTFGGINLGDTLSLSNQEVVRKEELSGTQTPHFTNNTLWNIEDETMNNNTDPRYVFGKKYSQVVVAPFSFAGRNK